MASTSTFVISPRTISILAEELKTQRPKFREQAAAKSGLFPRPQFCSGRQRHRNSIASGLISQQRRKASNRAATARPGLPVKNKRCLDLTIPVDLWKGTQRLQLGSDVAGEQLLSAQTFRG